MQKRAPNVPSPAEAPPPVVIPKAIHLVPLDRICGFDVRQPGALDLLTLLCKSVPLVGTSHCEGGHPIAHAEGSLVAEQGGRHSQTVQRPGHDLEGAKAAPGR